MTVALVHLRRVVVIEYSTPYYESAVTEAVRYGALYSAGLLSNFHMQFALLAQWC